MTEEQRRLIYIRGIIAGLPENKQVKILALAVTVRHMLTVEGDCAALAIALVGAELAAR